MVKLVVDSSVVVKWFVTEIHTVEALQVLQAYQQNHLTLLVPDLMLAEFGNILWKKQRLQGLSAIDAQEIMRLFRALPFQITPTAILLDEAYRIAVTHQRTVYDSLYIALSIRENCSFVTADERLVNSVRISYPQVIWVADWHLNS